MSCLSLVEHIIENCTDTYPHQTEILDGRWRSYDEFDEAVDEIFALLDQGGIMEHRRPLLYVPLRFSETGYGGLPENLH